jgi:hypothetical protein
MPERRAFRVGTADSSMNELPLPATDFFFNF